MAVWYRWEIPTHSLRGYLLQSTPAVGSVRAGVRWPPLVLVLALACCWPEIAFEILHFGDFPPAHHPIAPPGQHSHVSGERGPLGWLQIAPLGWVRPLGEIGWRVGVGRNFAYNLYYYQTFHYMPSSSFFDLSIFFPSRPPDAAAASASASAANIFI